MVDVLPTAVVIVAITAAQLQILKNSFKNGLPYFAKDVKYEKTCCLVLVKFITEYTNVQHVIITQI